MPFELTLDDAPAYRIHRLARRLRVQLVRILAEHRLGRQLDDAQVAAIVAFLTSLTGEVDLAYVAEPELPESGPTTPAPDPS